jgi:hypothetical protein
VDQGNLKEKDIESFLFNSSEIEIVKSGYCFYGGFKYRQLRITRGLIADIVELDFEITGKRSIRFTISVHEVKLDRIDKDAYYQAVKYLFHIKQYLIQKYSSDFKIKFKCNIVLCGHRVGYHTSMNQLNVERCDSNINLKIYTYKQNDSGFEFLKYKNIDSEKPKWSNGLFEELKFIRIK